MEKVWFKLRQTHYPPGPEDAILAGNGDDSQAPLCLGHCVADLKHIDFPINSGAIVPFLTRMRVFPSHILNFDWERKRGFLTSAALGAGAPAAAALGMLTAKASIKLAFQRSITQHEHYSRLDTYIVQPTRLYVEQCLERDELKKHIGNQSNWSFFMITGIKVARAGQRSEEITKFVEVGGGPELHVPGVATGQATTENGVDRTENTKEDEVSDFIWAIRLAKVHKGILMTDWSLDPYTHRATFEVGGGKQIDVAAILKREGLSSFQVIEDDELQEAVVLDAGDWAEA
ncbi:hypothetical protein PFICI_05409 [Pestalotiopsis fici W106-1]|uniref:Uncharacterized protein n=1 Tax=Pestalotiopsis fici (strain W106-1 / CGMCC3.15140) TaxID=1229662 RepID=W3XBR8_PESFW|nr:uncharacterized protein PFICI_05409 [Pestalotiopsis fici W106-1]ETS83533.1 hypothetical protein PFICI_05409 [Pestalotiopsis fici W106-1]